LGIPTSELDYLLTAQQVRAARGLLGWSRRELALVSRVSESTIKGIELGRTDAKGSTLRRLYNTFVAHSIAFFTVGSATGVTIDIDATADYLAKRREQQAEVNGNNSARSIGSEKGRV